VRGRAGREQAEPDRQRSDPGMIVAGARGHKRAIARARFGFGYGRKIGGRGSAVDRPGAEARGTKHRCRAGRDANQGQIGGGGFSVHGWLSVGGWWEDRVVASAPAGSPTLPSAWRVRNGDPAWEILAAAQLFHHSTADE